MNGMARNPSKSIVEGEPVEGEPVEVSVVHLGAPEVPPHGEDALTIGPSQLAVDGNMTLVAVVILLLKLIFFYAPLSGWNLAWIGLEDAIQRHRARERTSIVRKDLRIARVLLVLAVPLALTFPLGGVLSLAIVGVVVLLGPTGVLGRAVTAAGFFFSLVEPGLLYPFSVFSVFVGYGIAVYLLLFYLAIWLLVVAVWAIAAIVALVLDLVWIMHQFRFCWASLAVGIVMVVVFAVVTLVLVLTYPYFGSIFALTPVLMVPVEWALAFSLHGVMSIGEFVAVLAFLRPRTVFLNRGAAMGAHVVFVQQTDHTSGVIVPDEISADGGAA